MPELSASTMDMDTDAWHAHSALLQRGAMQMTRILEDDAPLGFAAAMARLEASAKFRRFFSALLRDAPFDAYRFETPPLTFGLAERPFEFMLVRDNNLDRQADQAAFREHFVADDAVVGFANLGRDAYLLVPNPRTDADVYAHLGAFMRSAPGDQVDELWRRVGEAMTLRLNDRPIWLNTAGGGVPWLHVRLDTRPKYYTFKPFARL